MESNNLKNSLSNFQQKIKTNAALSYKIFILIFCSLMLIFLTSKFYLPKVVTIEPTPIGAEKKTSGTMSLSLYSWKYNNQTGLMEIVAAVNSTDNNFHQKFDVSAINSENKSIKLNTKIVYSSADIIIANIEKVKPDFDGIKILFTLLSSETETENSSKSELFSSNKSNTAEFICTNSSVEISSSLSEKTQNQYEQISLQVQIEKFQAEIDTLKKQESKSNSRINEIKEDIKGLEGKLVYQTDDEKKDTYAAIEAKESEIKRANNELYKNQKDQESYSQKIQKYNKRIEELKSAEE